MSYQGLTFAIMVGVAIGTAVYYYFKNENPNTYQHRYREPREPNDVPYSQPTENVDTRPSNKKRRNSNATENCTICLDKLSARLTRRMSCGHTFHKSCINIWLCTKPSCPNCRAEQR